MNLFDLLTAFSFVMPITGTVTEAKLAHAGVGGYLLAIAIGTLSGIASAWGFRAGVSALTSHLEKSGKAVQKLAPAFYILGSLTWLILGDLFGFWIMRPFISLG